MARQQGLDESQADKVNDAYESSDLPQRQKMALRMTDAFLGSPASGAAQVKADLAPFFTEGQTAEIALAVAMFFAMSKVLISLGLEPDEMETTIVATPGSAERAVS